MGTNTRVWDVAEAASRSEAAARIGDGALIVYPTETVYGLGADALNATAIARVFNAKGRDRTNPISVAVHEQSVLERLVRLSPNEREFMSAFLPGPVTVVCEKRETVPDVLTGGRDRVGIRIPDHSDALALLADTGPMTATSANVTGRPSARRVEALDDEIREQVELILDGGATPGGASTVVDVEAQHIIRRGRSADDVAAWLNG